MVGLTDDTVRWLQGISSKLDISYNIQKSPESLAEEAANKIYNLQDVSPETFQRIDNFHLYEALRDAEEDIIDVGMMSPEAYLSMTPDINKFYSPEELAEKLSMPLDKVRKVLKIAKEPISLETPIGDEEDSQLGDFIEDKNAVQPLDAAIHSNLRETTTRVLASLTPREERVLRMRFGIGMNTDHTLEEVGQQFSVTRERIRQIEAKALRKLKHPSRSRKLRSFLEH